MNSTLKYRLLFAFIMSCLMAFLMSAWITLINVGPVTDFLNHWLKAFSLAWPAAFLCVLMLAPIAQRITQLLITITEKKLNKSHVSLLLIIPILLTSITTISYGKKENEMKTKFNTLERRNYNTLTPPMGPYSHAVKYGSTLYLSGFTAYGTEAQGKTMAEQAKAIFEQIKAIAHAEGKDLKSIVKVTIFITDFSQVDELRQELYKQYSGEIPASSMVQVAQLFSPSVNVEIEAILGL